MVTSSSMQQPSRRPAVRDIERAWRGDRCVNADTANQYMRWINRFRCYCSELGLEEANELTRDGAVRFQSWYARTRELEIGNLGLAISSMRSLRRVYEVMGMSAPAWSTPKEPSALVDPLLREYADHLRCQRGNPEVTVLKKIDHASRLLDELRHCGKTWRRLSLPDIDAFLIACSRRYARATTADIASSVRSFARFLLASGRIHVDLADAVISPVQPRFAQPRRAWPWEDVQRLLLAVDTTSALGLRDHTLLLMMATYGLGAGEVIRLQLQDIDWNAGTLQVARPKTGVHFILPMLPPIAKALARYLRRGRPPQTPTRHLFVQLRVPFEALASSSAVRDILIRHAKVAGIKEQYMGSHVLRHSNAARQLDVGTKARMLSDLLGHRDSESVSAYLRIATQSLREVSLPVPKVP
jgi:site-specific recombinase XerD